MKIIIAATLLVLAALPVELARAHSDAKTTHLTTHLMSSRAAAAGRFGLAHYSITLHVVGYELAEFSITPPAGTRLSSAIKVFDRSGNALDLRVEIKGETVTLIFPKPITIDTILTIELADVKTRDNTVIQDLTTSAKMGNMNQAVPLMMVRMLPGVHS